MTAARRPRWVLGVAVLACVATWCVAASEAHLGIIWRAALVSWDSPATQLEDVLATQAVAYVDGGRQLSDHLEAAMAGAGRIAIAAGPRLGSARPVSARLTRSPPASA